MYENLKKIIYFKKKIYYKINGKKGKQGRFRKSFK